MPSLFIFSTCPAACTYFPLGRSNVSRPFLRRRTAIRGREYLVLATSEAGENT